MKWMVMAALLAAAAAPAAAQDWKPTQPKAASSSQKSANKSGSDMDMAQMMKVFDKIFPAQPAPPAERLGLARSTAAGVLTSGTYAALFEDMMTGLIDRVLALNPGDFDKGAAKTKTASLREGLAQGDPHFEERMRITRRVIGEELVKISATMEPKLREGLALAIARRFDETQLRDINGFLATPSGRAFGSQLMRMWMDPDVMRSMFQSFPEMMTAMPAAMKRLEAETAHLPKPKKPKSAETKPKATKSDTQGEAKLVPQG